MFFSFGKDAITLECIVCNRGSCHRRARSNRMRMECRGPDGLCFPMIPANATNALPNAQALAAKARDTTEKHLCLNFDIA
eukprot:5667725-Amphidinium_carterae.2